MRDPFGARLEVPNRAPVDVSEILDDFTFRLGVPGGFLGASGKLWASIEDLHITANSKLVITDGATARTLWEGYLDSPGDSYDETGEAFDLSAQGAMVLVSDQAEQLLYLDTSYENWREDDRNDNRLSPSSQASVGSWPDSEQPALMTQFGSGTPIDKHDEARIIHDLADSCPMGVAAFYVEVKCGITSNGYSLRVRLSNNGTIYTLGTLDTEVRYATSVIGAPGYDNIGDVLKLVLRREAGATNIGTDRIWAGWVDPVVVGNRLDRFGERQLDTTSTTEQRSEIHANEVVEDLIARLIPMVDPNQCKVAAADYAIDQLVYTEPTRAGGVLEDLALFEPDFFWRVAPSGPDGRFGFHYLRWPSTPRYEISLADGYEAPGGESQMCNRVAVGWVDKRGNDRTEIVTRDVPALGGDPADAGFSGRVVDADKITLDESVSSLKNARRIGAQWLRIKNDPAKAATATVVRRVRDLSRGDTIPPWEMEPGKLVRLRETGENLRLTEVEVNTHDLSVGLTLGTPKPTLEQLVARLNKRKRRH